MTNDTRTTGPSRGPKGSERRFTPDPSSAREARQFVIDSGWSDDEETNMRLAAVVSELVTNAILHARTPFNVKVTKNHTKIRVDVSDESSEIPAARPYDKAEVTGRGLHIVDALTERWGFFKSPGGKTVWFEMARESAA
ncbi:MAG: ATP-binding protein [Acidimicrobiia bacterium]